MTLIMTRMSCLGQSLEMDLDVPTIDRLNPLRWPILFIKEKRPT